MEAEAWLERIVGYLERRWGRYLLRKLFVSRTHFSEEPQGRLSLSGKMMLERIPSRATMAGLLPDYQHR
jgi:hypothetical protein